MCDFAGSAHCLDVGQSHYSRAQMKARSRVDLAIFFDVCHCDSQSLSESLQAASNRLGSGVGRENALKFPSRFRTTLCGTFPAWMWVRCRYVARQRRGIGGVTTASVFHLITSRFSKVSCRLMIQYLPAMTVDRRNINSESLMMMKVIEMFHQPHLTSPNLMITNKRASP
jgi:hypothetical protein